MKTLKLKLSRETLRLLTDHEAMAARAAADPEPSGPNGEPCPDVKAITWTGC